MPFRYKNSPSIFQRVMQNVLTPFLWILALVYIDNIVIFSKSFNDHLSHLDEVFEVVAETGINLATTKCHFAYQSLLLLGQKVSCLGLSTHMEKVSAIYIYIYIQIKFIVLQGQSLGYTSKLPEGRSRGTNPKQALIKLDHTTRAT